MAEARSGLLPVGPWERILQMTWVSLGAKPLIVLSAFLRRAPPVSHVCIRMYSVGRR